MAHLPLHLVLSSVVMVICQLLIQTDCRGTEFLFILCVRNENVVVTENGTIFTTRSPPSLYSLMRMPFMMGEDYDGDHALSLEAVATRSKVCMNQNGVLYVKHNKSHKSQVPKDGYQNDTSETDRRRRRQRRKWRRKNKKVRKPEKSSPGTVDECAFRIHNFHPNESYYKTAIYSAAYSTPLDGRFLAFGRGGLPRSLKRPFKNLAEHARLGMLIEIHTPHSMERVINNTLFSSSRKINWKIRQCILNRRKNSHLFSTPSYRHHRVTQVIRTCRREHDPKFRREWQNARRLLKQNSMQRQKPSI